MKNTITQRQIDELLDKSEIKVETVYDKVTIVNCKLPNGFVITEASGAVDTANYDEKIGTAICMERIENKLWELEGYALAKQLYEREEIIKTNANFIELAISEVRKYVLNHLDKSDGTPVFDIFVVWSCKTLQNYKCLISTTLPDGMYYECTYNGDNGEMYLDVYKKFENKKIICEIEE